jgi:hypothetical protein
MEAEEVETGFTPATETEKLPRLPSKAEARLETTFISNSEAEELEDLADLEAEAEPMEVGFRIIYKQTIKFVDRYRIDLVIMFWVKCYKCLAHYPHDKYIAFGYPCLPASLYYAFRIKDYK